ncbi:4a-hydroxytetrahydrobiopterin dehydratase [Delftia sp. RIT313]|uniref:4a-hydroxytetrahydrobiopterin dehydratase n=1 Tax=Delftia sp. RIT313 TaxID=1468410 RepID=UPI000447A808|nr:4a-hydroxytetrahydrobiopterin dehydratase [Delftia sp. RIT313]EZP48391.1 putative pterin-4-alpha-carbinolamine dehydratase [Delftia sp. RIT313]
MSTQRLQQQDWSTQQRRALTPDELRTALAALPGWQLDGDAIAKSYAFANYYETMAFVNALALIAHQQDHHPDLTVSYGCCGVRLNTHDVNGISSTDIECARRIDALLERP